MHAVYVGFLKFNEANEEWMVGGMKVFHLDTLNTLKYYMATKARLKMM